MRIGVNLISIDLSKKTGVENLSLQILTNLQKIDLTNTYIVFVTKRNRPFLPKLNNNFQIMEIPVFLNLPNRLIEQSISIIYVYYHRLNVLFCPGSNPIWLYLKKTLVNINDIYSILFFKQVKFVNWFFQRFTLLYCKIRRLSIVTISNNTKKDLVSIGYNPNSILVNYCGVNENIKNIITDKDFCGISRKYNLPDDFLLYVGTIQPLKNIIGMVNVLIELQRKNINIYLVIVGHKGWYYDGIFSYIENKNIEDRVVFCGYVPDEELQYIYLKSKLVLLLSYYEGFGLPLIEAMYLGIPVIGSNRGSIPEVINNDELIFDPDDYISIANKIIQIISDDDIRKEYIQYGKKRARDFNWYLSSKNIYKILTIGKI